MRPIITGKVAWSVCRSVCLSQSWVMQKRLNRSRCRLGCRVEWAQGTIVLDGAHVGATWQIRLNRPCAAAMRPYVKLFGPHVIPWCYAVLFETYLCCANCSSVSLSTVCVKRQIEALKELCTRAGVTEEEIQNCQPRSTRLLLVMLFISDLCHRILPSYTQWTIKTWHLIFDYNFG